MVLLGTDGFGHTREPSVGSDDHACVLGHGLAVPAVPANAGHATLVGDDFFDRELLAYLDAGFCRAVDEQLVEHGPAGAVRTGESSVPGEPEIVKARS